VSMCFEVMGRGRRKVDTMKELRGLAGLPKLPNFSPWRHPHPPLSIQHRIHPHRGKARLGGDSRLPSTWIFAVREK
jgi:hypothetical protein